MVLFMRTSAVIMASISSVSRGSAMAASSPMATPMARKVRLISFGNSGTPESEQAQTKAVCLFCSIRL